MEHDFLVCIKQICISSFSYVHKNTQSRISIDQDTCMWYFYVLESLKTPNYFYKGSTNNIVRRFGEHEAGEVVATSAHRPYRLVYYEAYLHESAARHRESSVKNSGAVWGALMGRIRASLS